MNESGVAMIITLTNADRIERPDLFDQMFRSRAVVFHERRGWDVTVENGHEMDHYDRDAGSVYLLAVDDEPYGCWRRLGRPCCGASSSIFLTTT
jgi:N-acyl-L-homoserine lactone synthetase